MRVIVTIVISVVLGVICWAQVGGDGNECHAQAVAIGTLPSTMATLTTRGSMDYRGDIDWFTFQLEVSGSVKVYSLQESKVALRFLVFDSALGYLADGDGEVSLILEAGDYYLRVDSPDLEVGGYVIAVSNAFEKETNDGLSLANDLGSFSGQPLRIHAAISPVGDLDCFRFEVMPGACGEARLRITTSGPGDDDTIMVLYRPDEEDPSQFIPIASNDDYMDYWSGIMVDPEPGLYVVRVVEFGESDIIESYVLVVDCYTVCQDPEPNDTFAEAVGMGVLAVDEALDACGYIIPGDTDYFSFELTERARVTIETGGPTDGDSYIYLYDADGILLAENDDRPEDFWSRISMVLDPGRYTVAVEGYDETEEFEYTLTVSAYFQPLCEEEEEPNDDLLTAQVLKTPPTCVEAYIAPDDQDYFTFSLENPTSVVIETSGEDGDSYICLYDEFGNELDCDDDSGEGLWSKIEIDLDRGNYYVMVEAYQQGAEFDYTLSITQ